MADIDTVSTVPTGDEKLHQDKPETPEDSPLGVYAPFDYSTEPFADLSPEAKNALMSLDIIASKTDVAARRMEIEQAWEAIHFDRGYQHLLRGKIGGWQLPGNPTGFGPAAQKNFQGIYDTNIYSGKGDIIVSALSREVPKIEFFPANPNYAPDVTASEEADNFKMVWARNNNLHKLLVECSRIMWNEDRVLLWTRYELNGQEYGFDGDEDSGVPTVPENELNPPSEEPTGQEGLDDILDAEESLVPHNENEEEETVINAVDKENRKPRGREVTSAFGKLDHKVPLAVNHVKDMHFAQVMEDLDIVIVKAKFPWIADKIHPGSDKVSESELDRIARENVKQAVLGAYVTGDSFQRHVVVKHTWFRPSMFMDESVNDTVRAELFDAFPDGCLLVKAGPEYAFSRNEKMDDHIAIAHPFDGKGQNRRAMGTALISVQKRINDWVDLLDDFFKRTVPKKWYNNEVFDLEAMKTSPNLPGSSGPFQVQPGLTTPDQYILMEPTPQPQPSMAEMIQWFITNLSEEISGALPSLFGAATGEETVGNAVIQRDQALQRVGCPWNAIQDLFASAAKQAVKCAAECRDGKVFSEDVQGVGRVTINAANLAGGNVTCYAESNPAFPESWQQKEAKVKDLINTSIQDPTGLMAKWLFTSENLPQLAEAIRMKNFKVAGAASVTKQKNEFELLLRSGPQPNPQVIEAKTALENANQGYQQAQVASQQSGQQLPTEMANAPQQLQQLQQVIDGLPPLISTIPVAQDESENHTVEKETCFSWLNSTEGQKFKYGNPKQKEGYENVHLHWKEHADMEAKILAKNAPPEKPPSESLSVPVDKMPTSVAIQALAKMGINASEQDFQEKQKQEVNDAVAKKVLPDASKL